MSGAVVGDRIGKGAAPAAGTTPAASHARTAFPGITGRHDEPPAAAPLPEALADAVELRELRYFAAAARRGNLARAAQDMDVTAAAISQQLRKLERALGTDLLIRHGRGVTATPIGCRLLERIDAVVRLLNAPLGPDDPRAAPAGTLSLAIPAELAGILAIPVLAALRAQLPALTPIIKENIDGGAESWLLTGQTDIAILADPSDLDELLAERVLADRIGIAVGPRSPLGDSAAPMRLRDLNGLPLILPGKRHWLRRLLARIGFQRGVQFDPAFEVESLAVTRQMVRQGFGYAVLPAIAVREEAARGALVFRPLDQPPLTASYAVATARDAPALIRDTARTVHGVLQSAAAGDGAAGPQPGGSPSPASGAPDTSDSRLEAWHPPPQPVRGNLAFAPRD